MCAATSIFHWADDISVIFFVVVCFVLSLKQQLPAVDWSLWSIIWIDTHLLSYTVESNEKSINVSRTSSNARLLRLDFVHFSPHRHGTRTSKVKSWEMCTWEIAHTHMNFNRIIEKYDIAKASISVAPFCSTLHLLILSSHLYVFPLCVVVHQFTHHTKCNHS